MLKLINEINDSFRGRSILGILLKVSYLIKLPFKPWYWANRNDVKRGLEFDLKFGIETSRRSEVDEMDVLPEIAQHSIRYEPTPITLIKRILDNLPIKYEEFVFIDFGAGKCRTLLLASHYPFEKIVGIEVAPLICDISRNNIDNYNNVLQKCFNIELICSDASVFPIPKENLVLYLYNPFDDYVLRKLLSNVEKSLSNTSHKLFIVYVNPIHAKLMEDAKFLKLVEYNKNNLIEFSVYENKFA